MLASGMSYRVLVLQDDTHELSLTLLRKIRDLVKAGGVVIGPKPDASPSLSDGADSSVEVRTIADEVWGAGNVGRHAMAKANLHESTDRGSAGQREHAAGL